MEEISLDDLVGHVSLMLPKFGTRTGMSTKKLTSWAHTQETKSKGWVPITTISTTETSSYPSLGSISLSPSTVLCTIKDSDIDIGNRDTKRTEELVMAANDEVGDDYDDEWLGYDGYDAVDYSES